MNHAAVRLREPDSSVRQVADDLGFADPFHFSRVFRRVMGIPPRRYIRAASPAKLPQPNHLIASSSHVDSCT
jgi:AraC-like DNA-binding protein